MNTGRTLRSEKPDSCDRGARLYLGARPHPNNKSTSRFISSIRIRPSSACDRHQNAQNFPNLVQVILRHVDADCGSFELEEPPDASGGHRTVDNGCATAFAVVKLT